MPTYEIKTIIEAEDATDAEALRGRINALICPHDPGDGHVCPRGWFSILTELDDQEAAGWEEMLNR
jgi:hypothetical protein